MKRDLKRIRVCLLQRIKQKLVGEEVKGVGFMKDEELKLEEIEASLYTLGGYRRCRCYSAVRYTIVTRSRRICRKGKGLVAKKNHEPVCMRERGA
jgi:hypothetical protein